MNQWILTVHRVHSSCERENFAKLKGTEQFDKFIDEGLI